MGDKLIDAIAEKTQPILQGIGYGLADLELVKEGANWYLRFYIEHLSAQEHVRIDDCQRASEALSDWLDEADPIPQAYFLEVSSPGIERRLRKEEDFVRFQGHMVQINTYKPIYGGKAFTGHLGPASDEALTLMRGEEELVFERALVSGVRLYWDGSRDEDEEG